MTTPGGMTLIELVIVVAVVGILLTTAVPGYQGYMLRVHRTEAIRMLLQAATCQERIYATQGSYDTGQCHPTAGNGRYQFTYDAPGTQGATYLALATPKAAQLADPCGSLSLDQNGTRGVSALNARVIKCWNGR